MNQPSIPLSQLQCYLAFGLKMLNTKSGKIITLTGAEGFPGNLLTMISYGSSYDTDLWPLKPLVTPLDQLTDEDWVEVFKAGFLGARHKVWPIAEIFIERHSNVIEVVYDGKHKSVSYDFKHKQFDSEIYAFSQLAAFQKLFELHADVWGWVEAGLAINKLEVGK